MRVHPAIVLAICFAPSVGGGNAPPDADVLRTPETRAAAAHRFGPGDERLLDEIQRGCFNYFWKEVGRPARLAKDRKLAPVASIAAVGFQLSSLPIGVERGWIAREEGGERAATVLRHLIDRSDNKKFGMYLHFPDMNTAGMSDTGFVSEASTVDSALLIAGAMSAAEYFGGEVSGLTDRLIEECNWKAYAVAPGGLISMGWKPKDPRRLDGEGEFISWHWHVASDEERLVYFLAVGTPNAAHAVAPELYYKLTRTVQRHGEMAPFVVSWPGSLFTYFFSHCWIDYRGLDADEPAEFGVTALRVDWYENSRRAALTHRRRCIEESKRFKSFDENRWGTSPCVGRDGYIVPSSRPNLSGHEEWFEGTVAPYAAGSAIMFTPVESMAALWAFRELRGEDGKLLLWSDPEEGGYGFADSFNLDQRFVCDDIVGIDHGPMLLAIENARTGLIWKLFMSHPVAQRAVERLALKKR